MRPHAGIKVSFTYSSFAKGKEPSLSDIDIIIIGKISPKVIKSELFEYQSQVKRELNSTVYTEDEFLKKLKDKNHFISTVTKEPKTFLKGVEDEFRGFIQAR